MDGLRAIFQAHAYRTERGYASAMAALKGRIDFARARAGNGLSLGERKEEAGGGR